MDGANGDLMSESRSVVTLCGDLYTQQSSIVGGTQPSVP